MKTLKELIKQIEKVEGIKLSVPNHSSEFDVNKKIFNDYPYTIPISGDKTIEELLTERVYPSLHIPENRTGDEKKMKTKNNIIPLNDNLITGLNNLDQTITWFTKKYKRLNKVGKQELACRYENTYIGVIIEQINNEKKVKENKKNVANEIESKE